MVKETKPEPLKNKIADVSEARGGTNKPYLMAHKRDIELAVEWLKEEIKDYFNRFPREQISIFCIEDKIDTAFEDVVKK